MYHFATALIAGIIAAVLSGIAFVPTPPRRLRSYPTLKGLL
jgi:hypothetical protein